MPPPPSFFSFDIASRLPLSYPQLQTQQSAMKPKGPPRQKFTLQEDEQLRELVTELGVNNWAEVAARLGTRSARQCRERFRNYLSPNLRNGQWTEAEDQLLREKFLEYGAKWSLIVTFFPSRSEVNLKNRWTQLANRGARDLEQEKIQVLQELDSVIAGGTLGASSQENGTGRPEADTLDWEFPDEGNGFDFMRNGFDYGPFSN